MIFTLLVWTYTVIAFVLHYFIAAPLYRLFYKDKEWGSIQATLPFLKLGFKLFRFQLQVHGVQHLPKETPFVLISNHQSLLDIVVLMIVIPRKFAFIAKKELKRVPILGWDIRDLGHIFVDRQNPRRAKEAMNEVAQVMKEKSKSVLVFPEGTRSLTEEIGEFKRGAFILALQTGHVIVPCALSGTGKILHKKSLKMKPGKITVTIGKPITVAQIKEDKKRQVEARKLSVTLREVIVKLKNG